MTLERLFRVSVLTLVGTAMTALTMALGSAPWLVVGLGLFAVYLVVSAAWPRWYLPRSVATAFVVITLQGVLVEVIVTGTALVPAAHFLIITQLVWLSLKEPVAPTPPGDGAGPHPPGSVDGIAGDSGCPRHTSRHYGWVCLMSLLQMMLAGVLSVDMAFGVCLLIYLPVGVLTLLLFNLRCELERQALRAADSRWSAGMDLPGRSHVCDASLRPAGSSRLQEMRIGGRLATSAAFVTLAEMVLTLLVFIYFPRFGLQILQLRPVRRGPRLSGFSDQVHFGDIARILDNPEVVLSARLTRNGKPMRAEGFPLLWRGIGLDTYRDGTWSTRNFISESSTHRLDYPQKLRRVPDPQRDIIQEIALEPVNTRILFHFPELLQIRKASPNLEEIDVHRLSGTYSAARSTAVSLRYIVRSRPLHWPLRALQKPSKHPASAYDHPDGRFTQLPESLSPRVRELADQIVAEFPPEQVYNRVRKIETYLKARYGYSLRYGRVTAGVDPVEDFLFNKREGHCEYFAAAMVILLRTLRIPTRLVTGFRGGEWNEYGQFYIVRQRHAHAWVEVRLPATKVYWMSFDPTPAVAAPAPSQGWLARVSRRLAYLRMTWNTWVVNYSSTDQRNLAASVTRFLSRLPNFLPGWGRGRLAIDSGVSAGLRAAMALVVMVGVCGGMVFVVVWLRRRARRRRGRKGRTGRPAIGFYRKMDDLLRRRGFARQPSLTPLEFADWIVDEAGEPYVPVRTISDAFCRVFYGGRRLSPAERAEVHHALAALEGRRRTPT